MIETISSPADLVEGMIIRRSNKPDVIVNRIVADIVYYNFEGMDPRAGYAMLSRVEFFQKFNTGGKMNYWMTETVQHNVTTHWEP